MQNQIPSEMTAPDETGDVPVDKITSFNGRLSRFMHAPDSPNGEASEPGAQESMKRKSARTDSNLDGEGIPYMPDNSKRQRQAANATTPTNEGSYSYLTPPMTRSRSSSSLSLSISSPSPSLSTRSRSTTRPTTPTPSPTPGLTLTPDRNSRGRGRGSRSTADAASPTPRSLLRDTIPPNLILLLVGVNPGIMTGTTGFAYAHPSNLFWKLLHSSGITTIRHPPSDTYRLPSLYSVGNTNIVERATRDASMLSKAEMNAGVPVLEAKVAAQRPEAVCLVGKGIWEAVWRVRHGRAIRKEEFKYGWQDEGENMGRGDGWDGARVFVATTTSGLAATMSMKEKEAVWNELGGWVVKRREDRTANGVGHIGMSISESGCTDI